MEENMVRKMFEEVEIRGRRIRNRVVLPPMSLLGADEDGCATERMAEGYQSYAEGGFGLIITEGLYVDGKSSKGAPKQPGIINDVQAESWRPVVDAVHASGAVMVAQLAHIGGLGRLDPVAPSAVALNEKLPDPRELTVAEIGEIAQAFGEAAALAEKAGFDGVEVHGAMGLVQQFLSPTANRRTDGYGGSLENRMRVLREILRAIRKSTSGGFIVGLRVLEERGLGIDELERFFSFLADEDIDYVHTSEQEALKKTEADPLRTFSEIAKAGFPRTVIAAGGLGDPLRAEAALEHADMASVGKASMKNPDWPKRAQRGKPLK